MINRSVPKTIRSDPYLWELWKEPRTLVGGIVALRNERKPIFSYFPLNFQHLPVHHCTLISERCHLLKQEWYRAFLDRECTSQQNSQLVADSVQKHTINFDDLS
jgi:hypothetical protein